MNATPSSASVPSPKKGGLVKKILIVLLALVALVLIVVPLIVPGIAKSKVIAAVGENLNGAVDLGGLSFMWPASVGVENFDLRDSRGEKVVSIKKLDVDVALFPLLSQSIDATISVDRPEITLREMPDGRFSIETLAKTPPASPQSAPDRAPTGDPKPAPSAKKPEPPQPKAPAKAAPKVKASMRVNDGVLVLLDREGKETRFTDLNLKLDAKDGLDHPAQMTLSLRSGGGGDLALNCEITAAPNGLLDPDAIVGVVSYAVNRLDLGGFAALAKRYGGMDELAGVLQGGGEYRLKGAGGVSGKGGLALTGFKASGVALGDRPLVFRSLTTSDDLNIDASGRGTIGSTLKIDDFLSVVSTTSLAGAADADRKVDGKLTVDANFAGLAAAAPGLVKLKNGYRIEGGVKLSTDYDVLQGPAGLASASAIVAARVVDLAVFDAAGAPVPVDREATLDLEAAQRPDGVAELKRMDLRMGAVTASAGGAYDAAKQTVGPSFLKANADLDDLSKKLSSFLDLGFTFGGKISADARVEGGPEATKASSDILVSALRLDGYEGKNLGPLDVKLKQRATIDLRPGGRTVIETASVESTAVKLDVTGYVTDVADATKTAGQIKLAMDGDPAALQRTAGDFFAGYVLGGASLRLDVDATVSPASVRSQGKFRTNGLFVSGPTLGAEGLRIGGLTTDFDATVDAKTSDLDLRELVVKLTNLSAQTKDAATPVRLRELSLDVSATKKGADAELRKLAFKSDLASAEGSGRALGLGKPGMRIEGDLAARGELKPLVELMQAFVPEYRDARASGAWTFDVKAVTQKDDVALNAVFDAKKLAVSGVKAGGKDVAASDVDIRFAADVALKTSGRGAADLKSVTLKAPGVDASVVGRASGFLGENAEADAALTVKGGIDPAEVTRRLAAFLLGYELGGTPLTFDVDVAKNGATMIAKGGVKGSEFVLTMPADPTAPADAPAARPRVVRQNDLDVAFDLTQVGTPGKESLDLRTARFSSRTAAASAKGRLAGAGYADADLVVKADCELANIVRDLGAFLPSPGSELGGAMTFDGKVKGGGKAAKIDGGLAIKNLFVAASDEQGVRHEVREPSFTLGFDVDSLGETASVVINKFDVKSAFLFGGATGRVLNLKTEPEFVDVKGDFSYHPDKLGAVLRPFMSAGRLEGKEIKKVTLTLNGRAKQTDWVSVLRGSTGNVDAAIAKFIMPVVDVLGDVKVAVKDEQVATTGVLKLNGGDLNVTSGLDLRRRSDAISRFNVKLAGAKANEGMTPLLALVNPVFALEGAAGKAAGGGGGGGGGSGGGSGGGFLGGLITLDLDLSYTGQIEHDTFTRGADKIPYSNIDGSGTIGISGLVMKGSSLVGSLATGLFSGGLQGLMSGAAPIGLAGAPSGASPMDFEPVSFKIRRGRLSYDKPLKMSIAGTRMQWLGSVGLDRTLDMALEIPVTDKMASKHGFLSSFMGESIRIPVSGNASNPQLRMDQVLSNLAQDAIKRQVEKGLGGVLPGGLPIPGLGGDRPKNPPQGGDGKPSFPLPIPGLGGDKPKPPPANPQPAPSNPSGGRPQPSNPQPANPQPANPQPSSPQPANPQPAPSVPAPTPTPTKPPAGGDPRSKPRTPPTEPTPTPNPKTDPPAPVAPPKVDPPAPKPAKEDEPQRPVPSGGRGGRGGRTNPVPPAPTEPKAEPKVAPKAEPKAEPTTEPKTEPKAEPTPAPKTDPSSPAPADAPVPVGGDAPASQPTDPASRPVGTGETPAKPETPATDPAPSKPAPAPAPAPAGGRGRGGVVSADALLKQADALFDRGDKKEAAAIYQQLKSRHAGTEAYKKNKARIDSRAKTDD